MQRSRPAPLPLQVCSLGEEAHLNTCFKHFIFFSLHYGLIEDKELAPLQARRALIYSNDL